MTLHVAGVQVTSDDMSSILLVRASTSPLMTSLPPPVTVTPAAQVQFGSHEPDESFEWMAGPVTALSCPIAVAWIVFGVMPRTDPKKVGYVRWSVTVSCVAVAEFVTTSPPVKLFAVATPWARLVAPDWFPPARLGMPAVTAASATAWTLRRFV